MEHEIKFDGSRFADRRYYVDGYAQHYFTTHEDAEAALALASQIATNAKRELCSTIREALPD
jgi:hypothetical protein